MLVHVAAYQIRLVWGESLPISWLYLMVLWYFEKFNFPTSLGGNGQIRAWKGLEKQRPKESTLWKQRGKESTLGKQRSVDLAKSQKTNGMLSEHGFTMATVHNTNIMQTKKIQGDPKRLSRLQMTTKWFVNLLLFYSG